MLYITTNNQGFHGGQEWHVGEPWPTIRGSVVTFQADGHELQVMEDAMRMFLALPLQMIGGRYLPKGRVVVAPDIPGCHCGALDIENCCCQPGC